MKYNASLSGLIDRDNFAKTYTRKIIRDAADGKRSAFLPPTYVATPLIINDDYPDQYVLEVTDGHCELHIGSYQKRTVLQRHRYSLLQKCPETLRTFFNLDFDAYCQFYDISDPHIQVLARLRW